MLKLKKFSYPFIFAVIATLLIASTAFAGGGPPPVDSGFLSCRVWWAEWDQYTASMHDVDFWDVNGQHYYYYDYPHDQSPITFFFIDPLYVVDMSWHWGPAGYDEFHVIEFAPPCERPACHKVHQEKVVRYTDGTPATYDEIWFTNCSYVDYRSRDAGSRDTSSGIWFNGEKDWEWVWYNGQKVQHGFATPPTACFRFTSTLKHPVTRLAGGSWPTNPCK